MSHKDNADLRNTGEGGWFYAEHELFSVFVPLIGPDGGMVYMAMCRLIPLAAIDPDRQVTVRSVSLESGVSKSTTQRKMEQIVRLGMVLETPGSRKRPSTYKLESLRKVAAVGIVALRMRLGVPPGDTDEDEEEGMGVAGVGAERRRQAERRANQGKAPLTLKRGPTEAGKGTPENGVPPGDTEGEMRKTTLVDLLVSQNRGSVSQKTASVSQNAGCLKERREEKELNPLPPSAKGGLLPRVAASAAKSTRRYKSKTHLEIDGLEEAVAKVQRECGLGAAQMATVIRTAMVYRTTKTDEPPNCNAIAERMIGAYKSWLESQQLLAYKPLAARFFGELWDDQRKWPWDEKVLRERRRL
jgi:hypothetical protein